MGNQLTLQVKLGNKEYERLLNVEIPIIQHPMKHINAVAIEIDTKLMARKIKQEVAAKLREIADEIESEG